MPIPVNTFVSPGAMPSPGAMFGTTIDVGVLNAVSSELGSGTMFGDIVNPFKHATQTFLENVVRPRQQASIELAETIDVYDTRQGVIEIESEEKLFGNIPQAMHVPLMTSPVARKMLEDGEIAGFGLDPDTLPEEDEVGRLVNNGSADLKVGKPTTLTWEWNSTDPNFSLAELDKIEASRGFVDNWLAEELANAGKDPTELPTE